MLLDTELKMQNQPMRAAVNNRDDETGSLVLAGDAAGNGVSRFFFANQLTGFALLAIFVSLCVGTSAFANPSPAGQRSFPQENPIQESAQTDAPSVNQAQVDAVKKRAQKAQLEETKQQKVDASLAVAESNVARIAGAIEKTKTNNDLASSAETRVEELKKLIATPAEEVKEVASIPKDALAESLKLSNIALSNTQANLKEFQSRTALRTEQATKFAQTMASLQQQHVELQEQLKTPPVADENPILLEARKLELQSGLQWTNAETARIQSLSNLFEAEQKVLLTATSIEYWTGKLKRAQQLTDEIEKRLASQRSQDTQRAVVEAKVQLENAPEILKPFAEENVRIADLATSILVPAAKAKSDLTEETARLEKVLKQFTATVNRVKAVGETASVGAFLRNRKTEIPREGWLSPLAAQRIQDIEYYQSEQFDLKEKLDTTIAEDVVQEILGKANETKQFSTDPEKWKGEESSLRKATESLVERRKALLAQAYKNHTAYLTTLTELKTTENALAETTSKFHEYINERILWIRSNDVLFTKLSEDDSDDVIFTPANWINAATALGRSLGKNLLLTSLTALVLLSLFVYRFKFRQGVKAHGTQVARGTNTDFMPTLRTLLLTAAISAPFPMALAFLGWRMSAIAPATGLSIAIGKAFLHAGWFFFAAEFLRQVCRKDGLAEKHFGWTVSTTAKLKSELNWFVPAGALFSFVCSVFYFADINHQSDTIERLVFLASIALFSFFLWRILHPTTGMFREQLTQHPKAWSAQCSAIWFWSVILVPAVLMLMIIVGYYYSAIQMLSRIFSTIIAVVALEILRSLLTRFIMLSRRKARIDQSRAKLIAQNSQDGSRVEGNTQATELQRVADQEAFLAEAAATIDENVQRSQKLIVAAVAIAWVVSISVIWADVFPALRGLDKYALWTTTVETVVESELSASEMPVLMPMAGKMSANFDSKAEEESSTSSAEVKAENSSLAEGQRVLRETKVVSLRHLLMATFILVISFFAVRNLPAFLELVLLNQLPVEQSIRHAVKAILGYVILLVGVVAAGRAMYIGWSQIQWLATALTFGLAFGLQEIFANFIAGIILLLERPIRIGDVISVDDVTGTVSRIRIRATTITNFDRKEYVVPNKEFITGRVLNWTLSDKVNRMTVRVGVAYGSDVRKAKQIIKEICENHPAVVDTPPTVITFEEFGDSSLNITARTFLKDFDSRWPALDEINLAIDDTFKSEGIEISFPQRDLHIRSASPEFESSVRSTMHHSERVEQPNGRVETKAERMFDDN